MHVFFSLSFSPLHAPGTSARPTWSTRSTPTTSSNRKPRYLPTFRSISSTHHLLRWRGLRSSNRGSPDDFTTREYRPRTATRRGIVEYEKETNRRATLSRVRGFSTSSFFFFSPPFVSSYRTICAGSLPLHLVQLTSDTLGSVQGLRWLGASASCSVSIFLFWMIRPRATLFCVFFSQFFLVNLFLDFSSPIGGRQETIRRIRQATTGSVLSKNGYDSITFPFPPSFQEEKGPLLFTFEHFMFSPPLMLAQEHDPYMPFKALVPARFS